MNRAKPKLESVVDGTGSHGIVVQGGVERGTQCGECPERGDHGGLTSRKCRTRVLRHLSAFQESYSLRVLYKPAGVLLRRLNIAPRPIVNK